MEGLTTSWRTEKKAWKEKKISEGVFILQACSARFILSNECLGHKIGISVFFKRLKNFNFQ